MFNLLLYGLFATFSLGELGRISLLNQQINIYVYEMFVVLLLGYLILRYGFKPLVAGLKIYIFLLAFIIIWALSFLLNIQEFTWLEHQIALLYALRLFNYIILFLYIRFHFLSKTSDKKVLRWSILLFLFITALTSIIQYVFYKDLRNLWYLGWDPHLYRMFGVFFDTSVSGAVYALSFLYLFKQLIDSKKKNIIIVPLASLYFIFCLLTFSRSLFLMLGVVITYILFKKKMFKQIVVLFLLSIIILVIAPKPFGEGVNLLRLFSIESRFINWQEGITIWLRNPLFGIGYNHIRYSMESINSQDIGLAASHSGASFHSSFLILLVTTGVLGLISFVGFLLQISKSENAKVLLLLVCLLSLTDNILLHPFILLYFLVLQLIV